MKFKKKILYSSFALWLIKNILFLYVYFIYFTSRKTRINFDETNKLLQQKQNVIFVLWHGRQLILPAFMYGMCKFNAIISPHGDGRILAAIIGKFKVRPLYGSSNKNGKHALIQAIRALKNTDYSLIITPDGPRGPMMRVNSAVIDMAKHSGAAIIPISYSAQKANFAKSWDKFMIPSPFNKIIVECGTPILVDKDINKEQSENLRLELENNLNEITQRLDKKFNHEGIVPDNDTSL